MPVWQWSLDLAGVLLALLFGYAVALIARRRFLSRKGGTFELSYRVRAERVGRGWLLGLGRYSGEDLEWFRVFSLSARPKRTWSRRALAYDGRRQPARVEQMALYPGHVIAQCTAPEGTIELAMAPTSLLGFQSWLESSPPSTETTV